MDKQNVVYSYNVILISKKKKATTDKDHSMNGYQKHYA